MHRASMFKRLQPLLLASSLLLLCLFNLRPVLAAPAALAMPDTFSAEAAEAMLARGGNAVDAAISAAFVLAVTYPEAGNIGGGGFLLSYMNGEADFLDFRERAPLTAERDMYLNDDGSVDARAPVVGGRASGVPGTVHGLQLAHQRYGSLPWAELLAPAITLAREGFIVPPALAREAAETAAFLDGQTNFGRYFGAMEAGKRFQQPELAATLTRIAADPQEFYRGRTAELVVAQMERSGGLISAQDLTDYRAQWRAPLRGHWRGFEVLSAPPPSSGGIALLQMLMLREFSAGYFADVRHNSAQYVHLLAEIYKRAFADRAEYLGDPDFVEVPVAELLDPEYLQMRAAAIDPSAISPARWVPPGLEPVQTTHFSILDAQGNAVSLTYTLNWGFGSGVVVEGAGFLLNNEMDDFSAAAGVPNQFGVVGGTANAIAPGKRMLSSMTPTLLLQDDAVAVVIGTPGGSTIFTSVFQVLLNVFDQQMPAQAAVDADRYHHQLPEERLIRHDRREIPQATRSGLQKMGYEVVPNSWGNLGDIQLLLQRGGSVSAAADSRGRGTARVLPGSANAAASAESTAAGTHGTATGTRTTAAGAVNVP